MQEGTKNIKESWIHEFESNDSTILNFKERGEGGDAKWRGNCSPKIQGWLMWKYMNPGEKFAELFSGSGSGYDAAQVMGMNYVGADLNPNPTRPNTLIVDAIEDDVPEQFYGAKFNFMHPPYGKQIGIPYAGSMYADPTGELSKKDLGQMEFHTEFMPALNAIVMKYYAAMEKGSYMGILMGDVRRNGKFYSMLSDIVKPGELQQIIVKVQNNTMSGGRRYSSKKGFVPIAHEFLMIIRKPDDYIICYRLPQNYQMDVRDSNSATWRDVVYSAMKHLNGRAGLSQIYDEVKDNSKARKNVHWQEKVRQTLQLSSLFTSTARGQWELAA